MTIGQDFLDTQQPQFFLGGGLSKLSYILPHTKIKSELIPVGLGLIMAMKFIDIWIKMDVWIRAFWLQHPYPDLNIAGFQLKGEECEWGMCGI